MKFWLQDKTDPAHMQLLVGGHPASRTRPRRPSGTSICSKRRRTAATNCSELVLEGKPVSEEMLRKAIRQRHAHRQAHAGPVRLVQGIPRRAPAAGRGARLPAVAAGPAARAGLRAQDQGERVQRKPEPAEPFCGLAFKTVSEKHGDLVFVRIYSGELHPGDTIVQRRPSKGRAHQPHLPHDGRPPRPSGSRRARARSSPSSASSRRPPAIRCAAQEQPIALEEIRFPEPVIAQALIPAKNVDETKLADALGKMVRDDPTLANAGPIRRPSELILSGMGELHLEVAVHKLHARPRRAGDRRQADGGLSADAGRSRSRSKPATSSSRAAAASTPSSTCSSSR